jgi:ketosteroid isomerase-like protein
MSNPNAAVVRAAYDAYTRGDIAGMLDFVDSQLEWTYLDPSAADPPPQTCHGRGELELQLRRQAELGLRSELEEVIAHGDRVVVSVHTPGVDARRVRQAGDRNYDVLTVRGGRIVAMRACHDRAEALALAGID